MPLIIIALGVALLLFFMIVFKLNGFISLIIVSFAVGIAEGMPFEKVMASVKGGIGGTLGHLALVIGFGAMFGQLMADCGATQRITSSLLDRFGKKRVQWAVVIAAFIVGIPLFYEVGFVVMIPLIFTLATLTELPLLYLGVPMAAALSVTHGFLPPHPGPTAIAGIYKADVGLTLLFGMLIAVPTVLLAGPFFSRGFKKWNHPIPKTFVPVILKDGEMPGFWISVLTALSPMILMSLSTLAVLALPSASPLTALLSFIGDPVLALLISLILAILVFGVFQGKKMAEVSKSMSVAVSSVAMIIFVIGGGGAFKQVLVDSGVDRYIGALMSASSLSPLLLAWLIAAVLRIALGSATVAAMTAAGIVLPLIGMTHVRPELMVLATGAGSLIFSHVNDPGFWLFKEYFGLTISETILSWSLMETIISVSGLIGVLALNAVFAH